MRLNRDVKLCCKCKESKDLTEFSKSKQTKDGYKYQCKACVSIDYFLKREHYVTKQREYYSQNKDAFMERARKWKAENPDKVALDRKQWNTKNKELKAFYSANRRAYTLKATPPWADLEKIEQIYLNCPEGHHVDHIVPLKGKNVSGLHTVENLQYLPAQDNFRKHNKYEIG